VPGLHSLEQTYQRRNTTPRNNTDDNPDESKKDQRHETESNGHNLCFHVRAEALN